MNGWQTVQDYMTKKGLSRQTVYNMIEDGRLEKRKILDRTIVREP